MAITNLGRVKGESAYEAAVRNGFSGTEAEWIAELKGKDGLDAPQIDDSKASPTNPWSGKKIYDELANKAGNAYLDNNFAFAVKDTLSGAVVSTEMVSPIEHEVECKVERVNLIDCYKQPSADAVGLPINRLTEPGWYHVEAYKSDGSSLDSHIGGSIAVNFYGDNDYFFNLTEFNKFITQEMIDKANHQAYLYYNLASISAESPTFSLNLIHSQNKVGHPVPYVNNLSDVTLTRYSKNLLPLSFPKFPAGHLVVSKGIKFESLANGGIKMSGTATGKGAIIPLAEMYLGDTYISTTRGQEQSTNGLYTLSKYMYYQPSNRTVFVNVYYDGEPPTFNEIIYPTVNEGTELICDSFTPTADGIVTGMTSLSPSMIILSDKPGVNIKAVYNADTKKYIDKKLSELQAAIVTNV